MIEADEDKNTSSVSEHVPDNIRSLRSNILVFCILQLLSVHRCIRVTVLISKCGDFAHKLDKRQDQYKEMKYKRAYDSIHLYMSEVSSHVVAKSGIPADRYHLGKLILYGLQTDPDFLMQVLYLFSHYIFISYYPELLPELLQ